MSPLDDELRRTLSSRASVVTPAPDPMAGIDSRVSRIRRRRIAASAAGAALAVAAVAFVVPTLAGRPTAAPQQPASPRSTVSIALDADNPWAFRGTPVPQQALDVFTQAWQAQHPGGSFRPLWAQVWEPNGKLEMVFLGGAGSADYVGWATESGGGPRFEQVSSLQAAQAFYQFTVPGDEGTRRLYVVAAPGSAISYAANGTNFASMTTLADAVGVTPLEGDTTRAQVKVATSDGYVYEQKVGVRPATTGRPDNVLDWPFRGDSSVSPSVHDLGVAFTRAMGRPDGTAVEYSPLFTGDTDSGVRYTMGQAWFRGDTQAYTVSYATGGTGGPELFLGPVTPGRPAVLAFLLGNLPGTSVDQLVVVPQPNTGQVLYDADATGSFRPITGQDYLDGVVLIDRGKDASADRLEVLDGNGDMDNPTYRGPVTPLLCGLRECG